MTYEEACNYMLSLIDYERATRGVSYYNQRMLKLDRVYELLKHLDDPHQRVRCIHAAGTKGKGSTCAMIDSVLQEAGYKVGLFTQPGLIDQRERVLINRRMISKDHFCQFVERLKKAIERVDTEEFGEVTYFEAATALGLDYFVAESVDHAVMEVGMGGRLDSTNVIHPNVAAITPISFEHTRNLGHTLSQIAEEKAGIVKTGVPVATFQREPEAADTIRAICQERGAELVELGRHVHFRRTGWSDAGQTLDIEGALGAYHDLQISLLGEHQIGNAALATTVIELLRRQGISVSEEVIRRGLQKTTWPGRLQVVGHRPLIVLDGAHCPSSTRALTTALREHFKYDRLILVFGISTDKDISGVWRILEREAKIGFLCRSSASRATEPRAVVRMIYDTEVDLQVVEAPEAAFDAALKTATSDDLVCVTGSLYLVGDIMRHLSIQAQEEM